MTASEFQDKLGKPKYGSAGGEVRERILGIGNKWR